MQYNHYWLALSRALLSSKKILTALDYFKSIDQLFSASLIDLQHTGMSPIKNINWQLIENDLQWLSKNNATLIPFDDPNYPALLREIHDPPFLLYVQGNVNLLKASQIAIVGTRHPSVTGRELAHQFAKTLAKNKLVITSGLALGIDAASHEGALEVGGNTIAVLGTGLKWIYPKSHEKLSQKIIEQNGALISEFPIDTPPRSFNFPTRNRIISGLSLGVLVVEAAVKSGSLITARLALEQNREVFAIPSSIHNPLARGCHKLIRQGAKLVETAEDILEEMNLISEPLKAQTSPASNDDPIDLDPKLKRVLAQIGYEITALDVIILRSGLTAAEVSSMLLPLELEGYVQNVPGGYIKL